MKLTIMKNLSIFCAIFSLCILGGLKVHAQQPQGEFHKYIVKKTDDERRKTKNQEWWGAGVIMFSKEDIPRMGTIKEVTPMLQNSFSDGDKFVGRVYGTKHLGGLEGGMPESILYRLIENGKAVYEIESKGEYMPESEWSSWLIDLPSDLEKGFDKLEPGKHDLRIEVWSSREVEVLTEWKDKASDKTVGFTKENENRGTFLASGTFTFEK